jgi:hypothetical protein
MRSLTLAPLLALVLAPLGCGSPTPGPTASYSAEQLNAITGRIVDEDGPTPAATAAPMPSSDGGGEAEPPPPPQPAGLRVIHASPDRTLASVSAFLDDSAVAAVQGLAYKGVAGYVELTPGDHAVVLRRANAAAGAPPALSVRTDTLDPGERSTAIVYGVTVGTARLALAAGTDLLGLPEEGKARVRFFHALVGLGAVDLCLPGTAARPAAPNQPAVAATPASTLFANVAYGAFGSAQGGAYVDLPSGSPVVLQVRAQNARPCTGPVRGTVTVTPPSASVVTTVAVGRVVGAPAVPRELLVCLDAPVSGAPSCAAVAIR